MATPPQHHNATGQAGTPFHFNSAAHLVRIERERAANLNQLLESMRSCPQESIFQHTFRTLQEHHFIQQGFSNDFAHWAYIDCNEVGLAEQLAGLDVRDFTSIEALRQRIVETTEAYLKRNSTAGMREARHPFYFCASETVVLPTALSAQTLAEFLGAMQRVSLHSIHYHFIEARLRLKLQSNDFSVWLTNEMGLTEASAALDRIDIYTSTLEGVRQQIIRIIQRAAN